MPAPQKLAEHSFPTHQHLFSEDNPCSNLVDNHFSVCVCVCVCVCVLIVSSIKPLTLFSLTKKDSIIKSEMPHERDFGLGQGWGQTPALLFPSCMASTGFLGGSVVKNPPANAGDTGLILGLGRSPGGWHGNPLQYSCLQNPMDNGAWRATVHGVAKSQT